MEWPTHQPLEGGGGVSICAVPNAGQQPAPDLYMKGGVPRRGEQSLVVIISYKGYSPPKCTCNGRIIKRTSKCNIHMST